MCEYCDVFKTWAAPIDEDSELICERMSNSSDFQSVCGKSATWRVFVRRVEHHLCPMHLSIESRLWQELKSGLGTFGRQESVEFVPIDKPGSCDHADEEDLNLLCGRKATHAKLVTEVWHRCDEHAASVVFKRV